MSEGRSQIARVQGIGSRCNRLEMRAVRGGRHHFTHTTANFGYAEAFYSREQRMRWASNDIRLWALAGWHIRALVAATLWVGLAIAQAQTTSLPEAVQAAWRATGLPASALSLEVQEVDG